MSEGPLVSVVMAAYNMERFLAESVRSVLSQTWRSLELVVVDDGSKDGTAALADRLAAEDARIRVVRKPNGGVSSARNAGLAVARGELLAFLDADDVYLPDKLARQVEFLRLFPACDVVFSDFYLASADLAPIVLDARRPPAMPMREILVHLNWLGPPCTALLRMELQRRIGPFEEGLNHSEDWEFWLRASAAGTFGYLPGPVAVYRQHGDQATRSLDRMRRGQARVIEKHFARGSREWRLAKAAKAWQYAQWHFARREWARMAGELVASAWYARSPRKLKRIRALLSA